jgi:GDP-L-fucose synthase
MLLSKKLSETTPGLQAVTLVPSNVFGPDANCSASGPLLNALIAKAIGAAQGISSQMVVAGSGNPLRQVLYSHDLARVLLWAIENFDDVSTPLFVSSDERTVSSLAKLAAKTAGFLGQLVFDKNYPDGPLRRAVSSAKLKSLMKDRLSWTPLNHAIAETIRFCTKTGVSLT